MLLSKGCEIELYTGSPQGDIVGLSDKIAKNLHGFVREPDSRNVEYTTAPYCCYDRLLCALVRPRHRLRHYLRSLGDYTIIPGSTLSLGDTQHFYRSDPENPYHTYIEKTYHTRVVTASIHINIGISDPETLMRACRLLRMEAPLYLALSASSPFLDGKITGYHSTRWGMFPKTPSRVPLFANHAHYIDWTQKQLALGTMQNVRHLWLSVRPNGDRRPYRLNRLELRICDLVIDPIALLAIVAFLEVRLLQLLEQPDLDPLISSSLGAEELIDLADANEATVARYSLDAKLQHWQDGRPLSAREWIEELYSETSLLAKQQGLSCFLSPLRKILQDGNTAQQWLAQCDRGLSPREAIASSIQEAEKRERELEDKLCQTIAA